MPQLTVPPHPLGTEPQVSPAGHVVIGTQVHTLLTHVSPVGQPPPHETVPPHPLAIVPQLSPDGHEVIGTQVHTPLLHASFDAHAAHALPPVPHEDTDCDA